MVFQMSAVWGQEVVAKAQQLNSRHHISGQQQQDWDRKMSDTLMGCGHPTPLTTWLTQAPSIDLHSFHLVTSLIFGFRKLFYNIDFFFQFIPYHHPLVLMLPEPSTRLSFKGRCLISSRWLDRGWQLQNSQQPNLFKGCFTHPAQYSANGIKPWGYLFFLTPGLSTMIFTLFPWPSLKHRRNNSWKHIFFPS